MDEYVIDVVINGKADSLKTWCSSVYSAVDSMIGIDMVEDIKTITRTLDGKVWDVKDMVQFLPEGHKETPYMEFVAWE